MSTSSKERRANGLSFLPSINTQELKVLRVGEEVLGHGKPPLVVTMYRRPVAVLVPLGLIPTDLLEAWGRGDLSQQNT